MQPPLAPALSAAALSGSSVNLTWTDATTVPNLATSYLIEQSTDGTHFQAATTAPAGNAMLAIGGLIPNTTYYFRVRGLNTIGASSYSNIAAATTTNLVAVVDLSGGFTNASASMSLNGSAIINGSRLELTDSNQAEAGSAFTKIAVDITRFSTQFDFQIAAGANTGDGMTFTIQGNSPTALGSPGGGLGYSTDGNSGPVIANSVAIKFDLYSNGGEGPDSTGLYINGAFPTSAGSIALTSTGIDFHAGDVIRANMVYDGATLAVTLTDPTTGKSASQSYPVNISLAVGGTTAFVGFTGGTGGLVATQDILNWTFSPNSAQSPNAPTALAQCRPPPQVSTLSGLTTRPIKPGSIWTARPTPPLPRG